jgi:hypothetical protein
LNFALWQQTQQQIKVVCLLFPQQQHDDAAAAAVQCNVAKLMQHLCICLWKVFFCLPKLAALQPFLFVLFGVFIK